MDIKLMDNDQHVAKIKVIGVGGCGGNLVDYMSQRPSSGVGFVAVNTDSQALAGMNQQVECIQIGGASTRGLGAGGRPEVAQEAARAEAERLRDVIAGMDMIFVVAGMGKGTGTGASPVVAEIARESGVLTVALVVMPFEFENRRKPAEDGLLALSKQADSLIVAPNDKLREALGEDVTMEQARIAANDLLYNAVCGISDIINKPGDINVDFNDVRSAMSGKGKAVIGSARASGGDRATAAAEAALRSDLMENIDLAGASHILLNITGSDTRLSEMYRVVEVIQEHVTDLRGSITTGMVRADDMESKELCVTIIVTGVSDRYQPKIVPDGGGAGSAPGGGQFFESGRRRAGAAQAVAGGRAHRTPAVLRQQTN